MRPSAPTFPPRTRGDPAELRHDLSHRSPAGGSRGESEGPAHHFLRRSPEAELFLSAAALAEFAEGFASVEDPLIRTVREQHTLLPLDEETALVYARVTRDLRSRGHLIGTNDLWIESSSLRHRFPLVTADVEHFRRIDGLEVIAYREALGPG